MSLQRHGIMVCTTGYLPVLLRKFYDLPKYIFDLVIDDGVLCWRQQFVFGNLRI